MRINDKDNVEISLADGHKYAVRDIDRGECVIKYGMPIGIATADIKKGERVHTDNLSTALGELLDYEYTPIPCEIPSSGEELFFEGYVRDDGSVGIRNEIWIIPTVGCVNKIAERLAALGGAFAYTHPYGCSQLGDDMKFTCHILKGLVNHPNAGGIIVLGLGCENNNISHFKSFLGEYDAERVRFLNCRDSADEIADGLAIIGELRERMSTDKRVPVPLSRLVVGLKCGGSDGYSGITANPLVGMIADRLAASGAATVMTEVPEMFGAEGLLMQRCRDRVTFDKLVDMINGFKSYFMRYGQPIYENPSPGNKAGGISTLEEKSLGCVQKGGTGPVSDVLRIGECVSRQGLNLLNGPGNDICAITNLTAAGAHVLLFTTVRGTPLGAPVPTVKIATNSVLADEKPAWIDFDASAVLSDKAAACDALFELIIRTASGEETRNERNGYREIAVFHDGVTL